MLDFVSFIHNNYLIEKRVRKKKLEVVDKFIYCSKICDKLYYPDIDKIIQRRKVKFQQYDYFYLKINGKKRLFFQIHNDDDLTVVETLNRYFKTVIVPKKTYSKSIKRVTKQIQGRLKNKYRCILKTDIKDFYENVDHRLLLKKISDLNQPLVFDYTKNYLKGYEQMLNKDIGLPCGISFSQILSEFYLMDFDRKIFNYCIEKDLYYYRYCDDILILGKSINDDIKDKIIDIVTIGLNKLYLTINKNKTAINVQGKIDFLGYTHSTKKPSLSISKKTENHIKGLLTARIFKALKFCEKYIENQKYHYLLEFYLWSKIQINRVIKGTNNDWNYYSPVLDSYGIAPLYSLIDDHKQIFEMEKWLGSIVTYYKHKVLKSIDKIEDKSLKKRILENDIKLESLTNWSFKYKKNPIRALLKSLIKENLYPRIYIGVSYGRGRIMNEEAEALFILLNTKARISKSDIRKVMIKYENIQNSNSSNPITDEYSELEYDDISGDPDLIEWWVFAHQFDRFKSVLY